MTWKFNQFFDTVLLAGQTRTQHTDSSASSAVSSTVGAGDRPSARSLIELG